MFPSFTGSARPRRQVNLSGRSTNPFAAVSASRQTKPSQLGQNALAHAQQERVLRQQERERPPAATRIQKTWRGHRAREEARSKWRQEWDDVEARDLGKRVDFQDMTTSGIQSSLRPVPYESEGACLRQLRVLVQFASPQSHDDTSRLYLFSARYLSSSQNFTSACPADVWIYPLLRLAKISMAALQQARAVLLSSSIINELLSLLAALSAVIPKQISLYSLSYYKTLAEISSLDKARTSPRLFDQKLLETAILALLQPITARTITAYEGFVSELLVTHNLLLLDGGLRRLAASINYKLLASAINELLSSSQEQSLLYLRNRNELLWLLAYFLYFRSVAHGHGHAPSKAPDSQYIRAVSTLISHLADDIGSRIDVPVGSGLTNAKASATSQGLIPPLPGFVRSQILTLVDQESISSLLAHLDVIPVISDEASHGPSQASALATLALTLIRSFPRRAEDIRMWLYLGSTSHHFAGVGKTGDRIPAIKYFYQAARRTTVYTLIRSDPRETVDLLRPDVAKPQTKKATSQTAAESTAQQWRVILLFLELYTVLKVMDDEEFLFGSSPLNDAQSWTRKSALPLDQVQDLTVFLKNLAFSMYYNASDIVEIEPPQSKSTIAEYFSGNSATTAEPHPNAASAKQDTVVIAGIPGMTMNYMKGMITGLLRMVYERE